MLNICKCLLAITILIDFAECSFICTDGNEIDANRLCDGSKDCLDGSDEEKKFCQHTLCPSHMFRCCYGACTNKTIRCNGFPECADGSDEFSCKLDDKIQLPELNCQSESPTKYACPSNSFLCRCGGCVHNTALCDGFFDCVDGSDESEQVCEKNDQLKCPPLISDGLLTFCESKTGLVNCNEAVFPNTTAAMECKPHYAPVEEEKRQISCQLDGRWNGEILGCKPECGIRDDGVQSLIVNGRDEQRIWPWHAVLYSLENSNWTFSCGGTLISKYIVLTAAHCVWKKMPVHLQVALGKYNTEYNKQTEEMTQIRNISQIILQPLYRDFQTNYGSDIAVLFLDVPVEFSEYVRPICLDWDGVNVKTHLSNYTLGNVVGMGLTENDTFSETLRSTSIPVIPHDVCLTKQKGNFRKYVTYTTYCAGWANGTGVCNGDSGGGMVFRDSSDRWFLQGIVSVSPRRKGSSFCDPKRYTIFTKVSLYLDWLKEVLLPTHSGQ